MLQIDDLENVLYISGLNTYDIRRRCVMENGSRKSRAVHYGMSKKLKVNFA